MKRFAAHYLLLPAVGFFKQYAVEITDEGVACDVFPLTEEVESVEWMPGVIILLTKDQLDDIKNIGKIDLKHWDVFFNLSNVSNQSSQCLKITFNELKKREEGLFPYLLYPFDFTSMQPVAGTQHRLLR